MIMVFGRGVGFWLLGGLPARRWVGLVGGLLAALVATMVLSAGPAQAQLPPGCSENTTTVTCTFDTPGEHSFPVPAGVSSIHVVAVGGAGATGRGTPGTPGGAGGLGDRVVGDLAVGAGTAIAADTTLYVEVGGNGSPPTGTTNQCAFDSPGGLGGFNGGAPGGSRGGAGGGGASDIRTVGRTVSNDQASLDSRLLVAGGGGGGGGCAGTAPRGGGGNARSPGTGALAGGGGAGTEYAGGMGGTGNGGTTSQAQASSGAQGQAGSGGDGGNGTTDGGGGGGGGYFGGGGGGGNNAIAAGAGGGGGGSNLVPSGGPSPSLAMPGEPPSVTISYTIGAG